MSDANIELYEIELWYSDLSLHRYLYVGQLFVKD